MLGARQGSIPCHSSMFNGRSNKMDYLVDLIAIITFFTLGFLLGSITAKLHYEARIKEMINHMNYLEDKKSGKKTKN